MTGLHGRAACAWVRHGDLIHLMAARPRLTAKPANDVDELRAELAALRAEVAHLRESLPDTVAAAVATALRVGPMVPPVGLREDLRAAEKASMLRALQSTHAVDGASRAAPRGEANPAFRGTSISLTAWD